MVVVGSGSGAFHLRSVRACVPGSLVFRTSARALRRLAWLRRDNTA